MSIPYVAGAFRGWTKRRLTRIVTKSVVNHIITQTAELVYMDIMIAPLQPERVARKPEEQRAWKWYDLLTKSSNRALTIDNQIVVDGIAYLINSVQPWTEAGFRRYEVTENYAGLDPMYSVIYNGNANTTGNAPSTIAYQTGATPIVLGNTGTLTKTGYTFDGWNTLANGTGTSYAVGSTVTIGTSDITLYAKWKAVTP